MSYVPSESDAISSLYTLRFCGVNPQTSPLTAKDLDNVDEYLLRTHYTFEISKFKRSYIVLPTASKRVWFHDKTRNQFDIHEGKSQWKFKKSNNPQHAEHNHDLIPENLPVPWPPSALQRIIEYASSGLPTGDIRQLMQQEFPHLPWDERRFYNRLAEERKKIKIRETERRVAETIVLAARVASLACSNQEHTDQVQTILQQALEDICESTNIDPNTVINISSQEDMTTISIPSSSTSDIVCNYPAGSLTVKNIPAHKGRPPKKNLLPPQLQNMFPSQSSIQKGLTGTKLPKLNLASTLSNHPAFEPIHQQHTKLQEQQFHPTQSNVQIPLVSQLNTDELNSFSSSQPILQGNLVPHFQKQEQFYDFQPPQTNSHSQDSNQLFMSQEYPGMKLDSHLNPPREQINRHEQQILAPQTSFQIYSQPPTWEQPSFINYALTPDMLLRSCPQVFTSPQEEIIKQKLLRHGPTSDFQTDQVLNLPHSIQHMNSNIQSQNQQMLTPHSVEHMNYEKASQQATFKQQATPNTGDQIFYF
ncbi:9071_t:CDS:2 [Funneliformis mosseae]|uniref:9071_t:CDS:1 n=1 Tax=Funneliformis mosseae TaxID=27381 RepID=A0A9N9A7I2_FUNMO|nr:9071_t:CDS:2 [Funneliformis mosseae]